MSHLTSVVLQKQKQFLSHSASFSLFFFDLASVPGCEVVRGNLKGWDAMPSLGHFGLP